MNDLEFARPELWPWLLLLPAVWWALWWLLARSAALAARYGVPMRDEVPRPALRALSVTAMLALLHLCWMDPRLGDEQVAYERRGVDVLFCLDLSRSMQAGDLDPTRLQRARNDVLAVLPEMVGGDRVGLVVFAGSAHLVAPLTHDLDSFRHLLDDVDASLVQGGTDLATALRFAGELCRPEEAAATAVMLLTDGEDLAGAGRQAAAELKERGIVVHCVGYGSTRGSKITVEHDGKEQFLRDEGGQDVVSKLDADGLRAIATATGGEFVRAEVTPLPVVQLLRERLRAMAQRSYDEGQEQHKEPRYQWLLLPLLLLLLHEIVRSGGWTR